MKYLLDLLLHLLLGLLGLFPLILGIVGALLSSHRDVVLELDVDKRRGNRDQGILLGLQTC